VERLQQLMPTVQAKGIEDTAAYRYTPLLSLNEVGGSPGDVGIDVETFHARNGRRHERWPATMLATATHDHKRGEDVRARLNVLSELPDEWGAALGRWSQLTAHVRPALIDRYDEYVLHQVLLGAWPAEGFVAEHDDFTERVQGYMVKFAREAAVRTSWTAPSASYEEALREYVGALMDPALSAEFLSDRAALQSRISALGAINSLSQALLKLAGPGVADTYQGAELWDLSLVDPDNRRPVDYAGRAALLEQVQTMPVRTLMAQWPSAAVKLHVVTSALRFRRRMHPFFVDADYVPLTVAGSRSKHTVAFARTGGAAAVVAIAARLPGALCGTAGEWAPIWGDTTVALPESWPHHRLRDVFTGTPIEPAGKALPIGELLQALPVAFLVAE
jgi:(1->4)-alpha-D-glucan 1-alpha-D-glucosylmutase